MRSIRLGPYRYMKCQKCWRWALFNIVENLSQTQRNGLGNSDIIAAVAIAILGCVLIASSLGAGVISLSVAGIILFAAALLMAWIGFVTRNWAKA